MFATVVNALAIIGGCLLGLIAKERFKKNMQETIMNGLALVVFMIGITGAFEMRNPLLIILSIAIGGIIGEVFDLDFLLNNLGAVVERYFKKKFSKIGADSKISEGFVTATLLYCVGAMAIVGSLQAGLEKNYDMLFAKSILDGISAIVFGSTLGIGVALSAISVFLYQGIITISAQFISVYLTQEIISNISNVGSFLIIGLAFNLLGMTKIRIANLLPAILIPLIYGFFS